MKLNSPRKDPYSSLSRALENMAQRGYTEEFTVMDEDSMSDTKGNSYTPEDLVIDAISRLTDNNHFLTDENKRQEDHVVYAINANNGVKGTLVDRFGDKADEVVDQFLQNVDRHDDLNENYSA